MLINAGGTHPHALWPECLREGGRLVVPLTIAASPTLGPTLGQGAMVRIVRQSGGFSANIVTFLAIFNGGNLRDPELEAPLRKAMTTGALLKLKSLRRDSHEQEGSCLYHIPGMCLSDPSGFSASRRWFVDGGGRASPAAVEGMTSTEPADP